MTIQLIVGLQNPGPTYASTRHNAGAWLVESLVDQLKSDFKVEKKMQAMLAKIELGSQTIICALPLTYMNLSGLATRSICNFYRIEPEDVLVVHDDLDLQPGRVKLKTGGGHGGHNGLKDIISHLGGPNFQRLRIGIGHPGNRAQVENYVLSKPNAEDKRLINTAIENSLNLLPKALELEMEKAINLINSQELPQ